MMHGLDDEGREVGTVSEFVAGIIQLGKGSGLLGNFVGDTLEGLTDEGDAEEEEPGEIQKDGGSPGGEAEVFTEGHVVRSAHEGADGKEGRGEDVRGELAAGQHEGALERSQEEPETDPRREHQRHALL